MFRNCTSSQFKLLFEAKKKLCGAFRVDRWNCGGVTLEGSVRRASVASTLSAPRTCYHANTGKHIRPADNSILDLLKDSTSPRRKS